MSDVSFPGPGQHDGPEPPLPGGPARDEGPGDPGDWTADDDAEMARFLAGIEAGREQIPGPWSSPACTVSLGEACDVDLGELAAMTGPDGLAGETFAQGRAADAMRPGPVLSALTERAAEDVAALTDDALLGLVSAARRAQARAEYLELAAVAEFTRRRAAQLEAAKARKVPRGCRGASTPIRSWRSSWSPPPMRPATGWTWPRTWPAASRTPSPGWRPARSTVSGRR